MLDAEHDNLVLIPEQDGPFLAMWRGLIKLPTVYVPRGLARFAEIDPVDRTEIGSPRACLDT